jgi:hypothetical protein
MDQYIQAAIDAERAGRPIPLTANAAIKSLKFQISQIQRNEAKDAEIAALQRQLKEQGNPARQIDVQAYSNIDGHLMSALKTVYGADFNIMPHFNAIGGQIVDEIKQIQREEPETWDRIRRDPTYQRKMVNYFVEQSIPPKARQLLQEEQIRQTPLTGQDLHAAWRETKELLSKDPQNGALRKQLGEIREQLLSTVVGRNMPGAGRRMGG